MPSASKAITVRFQVLQGRRLAPKDKNGLADPYTIVNVGKKKQSTHIVYEDLNPVWNCSFDFGINPAKPPPTIILVVWDYNRWRHAYMGEIHIPLLDLFTDNAPNSFKPGREHGLWYKLTTGRGKYADAKVSGDILINAGFVLPTGDALSAMVDADGKTPWDTLNQTLFASSSFSSSSSSSSALGAVAKSHDSSGSDHTTPESYYEPGLGAEGRDRSGSISIDTQGLSPAASPALRPDDSRNSATAMATINSPLSALLNAPDSPNEPKAYMSLWDSLRMMPMHLRVQPDTPGSPGLRFATLNLAQGTSSSPGKSGASTNTANSSPAPGSESKPLASTAAFPSNDEHHSHARSSLANPVPVPQAAAQTFLPTSDRGSSDTLLLPMSASGQSLPAQSPSHSALLSPHLGSGGGATQPQGVIFIEVNSASDLPRAHNVTRTGFDMDPFVVIGFSRKTWRTSTKRHKLNPQWNEKLSFEVTAKETHYPLRFSVYDYDKLSNNDHIGTTEVALCHVVRYFENQYSQIQSQHDLFNKLEPCFDMEDLPLDLALTKKSWQDHHNSQLHIRLSYAPYSVLRSKFWLAMCRQYDSDENGSINLTEIQTMLDSLSSTLSDETIEDFFVQKGKRPEQDELEFFEVIQCLESYILQPQALITAEASPPPTSELLNEPMNTGGGSGGSPASEPLPELGAEDSAESSHQPSETASVATAAAAAGPTTPTSTNRGRGRSFLGAAKKSGVSLLYAAKRTVTKASRVASRAESEEPDSQGSSGTTSTGAAAATISSPLLSAGDKAKDATAPVAFSLGEGGESGGSNDGEQSSGEESTDSSSMSTGSPRGDHGYASSDDGVVGGTTTAGSSASCTPVQRIISPAHCPICQKTSLRRSSDLEATNHVALCFIRDASKSQRERFVMGNFVTEAQAQRKWFTRLVKYVGYGGYAIGKNNANIIVIDRATGNQIEEKIPAYIRLGIRLLYRNIGQISAARMKKTRNLLRSLSVKQGRKYDDPSSARLIPSFIQLHRLNVDEILEPLDSFANFNEFFYRRLKPEARRNAAPDDPAVALSPADCRCMVFNSLSDATQLWIKGRHFNLTRLLGGFSALAGQFTGGKLAIFRLAPQDYHRFHIPVDGLMLESHVIASSADSTTDGEHQEEQQPGPSSPQVVDPTTLATALTGGGFSSGTNTASSTRVVVDKQGRTKTLIELPYTVPGDYYTVNPMAIRTSLDVFGENIRVINLIQSPQFGLVAYICIGAMMVGSIEITSQVDRTYHRMDEHGYFKFGGSTCILLFQKDAITFDQDIVANSNVPIETFIKMGDSIGRATASATAASSSSQINA
ncbi:phosphatidylserine decarboxylase [Dimargaris verticillata]|uniref:Phosphatidylserine decarboxylase n=1 Tax=Dimargaris verticillata TaxID=2761393 RepID=A0A9W8E9E4_9FUNG|nr:phosphatidylserine decarboxylase [Dimargaris verticillata]